MHKYKNHVKLIEVKRNRSCLVEQAMASIIIDVFKGHSGHITIAVGGPGGTGKSSFSGRLAKRLRNAAVLRLDDYKTSREQRQSKQVFGPHPQANKMALIVEHLALVKRGQEFDKPVYDATAGDSVKTEHYVPARFNIIDGEVSTYREFREYVDFSLYIDADWHTQLATRLGRDITVRNYSPEKAVATFLHSNLREFTAYGAESKKWADIHLFCHDDYRLEIEAVSPELFDSVDHVLHNEIESLDIAGLFVPLLTPFRTSGEVDYQAFLVHLDWLAAAGIRRVIVGGTTGEFFSLTGHERIDLLKLALEYFPRLVVFNVSCQSLAETVHLADKAEKLGADGIVCLPPYYYAHASPQGVINYFSSLAKEIRIPLLVYNFPHHTQNPVTPELLSAVQCFGLKDSSGDLSLIKATKRYFQGCDSLISQSYKEGAKGFISGMANVVPEIYLAMEGALSNSLWAHADTLQQRIDRLHGAMNNQHEIPVLKYVLSQHLPGYPGHLRPPLTEPDSLTRTNIDQAVQKIMSNIT